MAKVILWDWDNTLADTFGAIFAAQNDARVQYGLTPWTKEESKAAMNTSGRNLIKDVFGEEKAAEVRSYFLTRYAKHADALELKEGAKEVLKTAKELGFINILASNKAGPILRNEVSAMGISDYFDRLIGAEDTPNDKPSKDFTDAALLGFDVEKIISIGDGKADIQMAHNYPNGIGVLVWTNPDSGEFNEIKPDYTAQTLTHVIELLKKA
ncbi:MAG: HAD-IA family hydrolase [Alphaproteobacteria bacterium]|nr:HAD-IA family hydrolase [Alphaproteobacteria bacterium]